MALANISVNTTLETTSCCVCGVAFAAPESIMTERRKNAGEVYCPNGHRIGWHESEADRLRKKLAEQTREATRQAERAAQAQRERDAEAALRVKAERKLKRVQKGVCPCCTRTFTNLARHMQTKHPDAAPVLHVGALPLPKSDVK